VGGIDETPVARVDEAILLLADEFVDSTSGDHEEPAVVVVGAELGGFDHIADLVARDGKRAHPNAHVCAEYTAGAQSFANGDIGYRGYIVIAEKQILRGIEKSSDLAVVGYVDCPPACWA
jgi:hypothetical protein